MKNVQVRIRNLPAGAATPEDFALIEQERPAPGKGEMLVRARWLALDPAVLSPNGYPRRALKPGDVTPACGVCEVVDSRNEVFNIGDLVVLEAGLQRYCVTDGLHVHRVRTGGAPASAALGIMGTPGLRAYCGLLDVAHIAPGETVLVSAAGSAAGYAAGQIARIRGCRTIGITASADAAGWCVREAHFDACINYRTESLDTRLRKLAPKGVDVYFDNLYGALDGIIEPRLGNDSRKVAAHLIDAGMEANASTGADTSTHFEQRREAFLKDVIAWFADGHLRYRESVVEGLASAPALLCELAGREIFGEALVRPN